MGGNRRTGAFCVTCSNQMASNPLTKSLPGLVHCAATTVPHESANSGMNCGSRPWMPVGARASPSNASQRDGMISRALLCGPQLGPAPGRNAAAAARRSGQSFEAPSLALAAIQTARLGRGSVRDGALNQIEILLLLQLS
mmetsp:Transcript_2769/g.8360  ORF Transcript_2769/g.8360 Transcript_2769/m.8360 type:complete len:140 (-) Transcript_2769:90-509(-)